MPRRDRGSWLYPFGEGGDARIPKRGKQDQLFMIGKTLVGFEDRLDAIGRTPPMPRPEPQYLVGNETCRCGIARHADKAHHLTDFEIHIRSSSSIASLARAAARSAGSIVVSCRDSAVGACTVIVVEVRRQPTMERLSICSSTTSISYVPGGSSSSKPNSRNGRRN